MVDIQTICAALQLGCLGAQGVLLRRQLKGCQTPIKIDVRGAAHRAAELLLGVQAPEIIELGKSAAHERIAPEIGKPLSISIKGHGSLVDCNIVLDGIALPTRRFFFGLIGQPAPIGEVDRLVSLLRATVQKARASEGNS